MKYQIVGILFLCTITNTWKIIFYMQKKYSECFVVNK